MRYAMVKQTFDSLSNQHSVAIKYDAMKGGDAPGCRLEETQTRETISAQKLLNLPENPNQTLIAKGVLMKICRKKPKYRTFFLFNDLLIYASSVIYGKSLVQPSIFPLDSVSVCNVVDSGIFRNGFIIKTPRKSFTVYATIADEKQRWMEAINYFANEARVAADAVASRGEIQKCPIWIPNSEAMHCMVCLMTEFTVVQRRHHCRNCGKVVCAKCSQFRWVLPSQGPKQLRICTLCHEKLRAEQCNERSKLQFGCTQPPRLSDTAAAGFSGLPELAPPNWRFRSDEDEEVPDGANLHSSSEASIFSGDLTDLRPST